MTALPSGYLSLDEMYARVGSEMFQSEWTNEEPKIIVTLPSDYWRLPETISGLLAWHQSSDWPSEDADAYAKKKAIQRFLDVAGVISHRCSLGEYLIFLSYTDDELREVISNMRIAKPFGN